MVDGSSDDSGDGVDLGSVLLPPVVHEASAAVLIVDLAHASVVYVNDLASQLAPGIKLPVSVDDWSIAAGLEDVRGDDLPDGPPDGAGPTPVESLLRIAHGQPVTGEAVTARRQTEATASRETLWVLGLPLSGAPEPMSALALVVFLPARDAQLISGAQESAITTRERAVLATRMSFTITDPSQPDDPLVWVNPAFTATTGYSFDDAVGRNCRFLQGPDTDRGIVAEVSASLRAQRPITTTLLNYRADGSTFWNELSISPVRDESGKVVNFVGVQADVTARVEAQLSRDEALSQVALAADRLALLADFTSHMATSRKPDQIVDMLGSVLTPRVGRLSAVVQVDESGRALNATIAHADTSHPGVVEAVEQLRSGLVDDLDEHGPILRVLRGEAPFVTISDLSDLTASTTEPADSVRQTATDRLGLHSMLVLPLQAQQGILGAIVAMDAEPNAFGDNEVALVQDLAVRAGLMLENTILYAREQATAATLQRSLLPRLPKIDGLEIAASYVPAADEAAVGGDWYDVFPRRKDAGGGVGVVVGDVMGHNYDSAARMGKLSTIVRAYGWPGSEPYTVLTAVDELLAGSELDYMATCLYATLTLHGNGATLRYSSAGHPPAILRRPRGSAVILDDGRGPMIGISRLMPAESRRPDDAVIDLASGSTLICFTDGLTDALGGEPDLDAGLAELCRLADSLPVDAAPADIVAALTGAARRHDDDVAVVAIRIR